MRTFTGFICILTLAETFGHGILMRGCEDSWHLFGYGVLTLVSFLFFLIALSTQKTKHETTDVTGETNSRVEAQILPKQDSHNNSNTNCDGKT